MMKNGEASDEEPKKSDSGLSALSASHYVGSQHCRVSYMVINVSLIYLNIGQAGSVLWKEISQDISCY